MKLQIYKSTLIIAGLLMAIDASGSLHKTKAVKNNRHILDTTYSQSLPSSKFFHTEWVAKDIVRIRGVAGELMYLVQGKNKACLIDAGTGVGNLNAFVKQITHKPITVIITHGHVDHAFGSANFENVYMSHEDDSIYTAHSNMEFRRGFIKRASKDFVKFSDADFVKSIPLSKIKDIKGDTTFDLGGSVLDIYHFKGHTPGQLAVLFRKQRILLTGDGANQFTFLFTNPALGIGGYEQSIKTLLAKSQGKFDRIFVSHGSGDASKDLLSNLMALCEDIRKGKSDEVPFKNFMGSKEYVARKFDPKTMRREDGLDGNIVYSKDQVTK